MSNKICVLFGDGAEEIELLTPVDILRRCKMEVILVSAKSSTDINCANGVRIIADTTLDKSAADEFDALVLPGGPGSFDLKDDQRVLKFVKNFHVQNKLICAICAAPLILYNAGVLQDKKYCAHPCTYSILKDADKNSRVVVSKNLITAKGPGAAAEFAFAIVANFLGEQKADEVSQELFFPV